MRRGWDRRRHTKRAWVVIVLSSRTRRCMNDVFSRVNWSSGCKTSRVWGSDQIDRQKGRERHSSNEALTRRQTEKERKGWQVNKTSPRIHHYLAMDIEYQLEDRRRLHISLLLLKMTNIFWRAKDRDRKRDGWDMEPDGDWHSIFLNSNPITSLWVSLWLINCAAAQKQITISPSQ